MLCTTQPKEHIQANDIVVCVGTIIELTISKNCAATEEVYKIGIHVFHSVKTMTPNPYGVEGEFVPLKASRTSGGKAKIIIHLRPRYCNRREDIVS